jgi:outer membrane protein OmpA-like peptidoglycan-associated protein
MILKKIGILICFTAMIIQARSQRLNIELDGGLQGTKYSLPNGKTHPQSGGSLGLSYTYPLRSDLDLIAGISGGIYRTQATLQNGSVFSTYLVDDLGSAFKYNVKPTGYRETQRFLAVSVPLLVQYHTSDEPLQWYIDGGAKVLVPFASNIQVSAKQLELSGYYPDYNIEVANLPQHGFGTIDNWKGNASTKLKPSVALSAATGVSFNVLASTRIYAGVYIDYGLTNLKGKNDSLPLATYSSNGVTSVKAGSVLNRADAGGIHLLSFGLQVRLSLLPIKPASEKQPKKKDEEPQLPSKQPQPSNGTMTDEENTILTSPVLFGYLDQTELSEPEKKHLDDVADILKQYPAIRITLTGHVCDDETAAESKKIGVERAKAVAQYLKTRGISAGRITVSSTSVQDVTEPFNPLANYQNRKVVVEVKK